MIGLRNGDGTLYGPWQVETALDQEDVPKGYWIAHPNQVIPAGSYTVEDSDPETWSQNSESPCGFTKIEGYPSNLATSPAIRSSVDTTSNRPNYIQTATDSGGFRKSLH